MANNLESVFNPADVRDTKTLSQKNVISKHKKGTHEPNYTVIAQSPEFKSLKSKKNKFILLMSIFFFVAYMLLPVLTSYTTVLNVNAFGDVAWVWVYAISLFIMTWVFCMIYVKKANGFDEEADKIVEKEKAGDY